MIFLIAPFSFVLITAGIGESDNQLILAGVVLLAASLIRIIRTNKKRKAKIEFTDKGVINSGKLYRYDAIESYGVKNWVEKYNQRNIDDIPYSSGLYIIYGQETVWLARGIHDSRVQAIFKAFESLMQGGK